MLCNAVFSNRNVNLNIPIFQVFSNYSTDVSLVCKTVSDLFERITGHEIQNMFHCLNNFVESWLFAGLITVDIGSPFDVTINHCSIICSWSFNIRNISVNYQYNIFLANQFILKTLQSAYLMHLQIILVRPHLTCLR